MTFFTALFAPGAIGPRLQPHFLTGTNLNTNLDLDALFGGIVEIILKIGLYVGAALVAGGVLQLLISYLNDQPEGKASALRIIVVGGSLMGLRALLQLIGLI